MRSGQITDVEVIRVPLRSKFRGVSFREALIFKGSERYAEFSPFLEYEDQESSNWLRAAIEFANTGLSKPIRNKIEVNATLPAVTEDEIAGVLLPFGKFETVKIKVAEQGEALVDDVARVFATNKLFPGQKIRLDANGGYSVKQALELLQKLDGLPIEYFEQPVETVEQLVELKSSMLAMGLNVKIAADESIRKANDPMLVAASGAADIAVLKVQPLGGISSALEMSKQMALEPVVSSALETSLGISQGLFLASLLPSLDYACGLGTVSLLAADIAKNPLIPVNGFLEVQEIELDQDAVRQLRVDSARREFWHQRLDRCLNLL